MSTSDSTDKAPEPPLKNDSTDVGAKQINGDSKMAAPCSSPEGTSNNSNAKQAGGSTEFTPMNWSSKKVSIGDTPTASSDPSTKISPKSSTKNASINESIAETVDNAKTSPESSAIKANIAETNGNTKTFPKSSTVNDKVAEKNGNTTSFPKTSSNNGKAAPDAANRGPKPSPKASKKTASKVRPDKPEETTQDDLKVQEILARSVDEHEQNAREAYNLAKMIYEDATEEEMAAKYGTPEQRCLVLGIFAYQAMEVSGSHRLSKRLAFRAIGNNKLGYGKAMTSSLSKARRDIKAELEEEKKAKSEAADKNKSGGAGKESEDSKTRNQNCVLVKSSKGKKRKDKSGSGNGGAVKAAEDSNGKQKPVESTNDPVKTVNGTNRNQEATNPGKEPVKAAEAVYSRDKSVEIVNGTAVVVGTQ